MAYLTDEHFYTNLYHGLQEEDKKTIRENIIRFQEGTDILDNTGTSLSFATIFTGPLGKAGAFLANRLVDDLKETGQERLNNKIRIIAVTVLLIFLDILYSKIPLLLLLIDYYCFFQYSYRTSNIPTLQINAMTRIDIIVYFSVFILLVSYYK